MTSQGPETPSDKGGDTPMTCYRELRPHLMRGGYPHDISQGLETPI